MHTARNLTLEDFYLLNQLHGASPVEPDESEAEDDELGDEEDEEDDGLVIEGDDAEDEDEDEEDDVDDTDAHAASSSVRRPMGQ